MGPHRDPSAGLGLKRVTDLCNGLNRLKDPETLATPHPMVS